MQYLKNREAKACQYAVNTPVVNVVTGEKEAMSEVSGDNSALTVSCWGMTEQYINASLEAQVKYDRMFGKHGVSASRPVWAGVGKGIGSQ